MSFIFNGGAGGGSGTVTNTGGALTSNAVVLGAGGNDTKVLTSVTTNGVSQLNLGVAGGTTGSLGLVGTTAGTATFTGPADASTVTNPVVATNSLQLPSTGGGTSTPHLTFGDTTTGLYRNTTNQITTTSNGTAVWTVAGLAQRLASTGSIQFASTVASTGTTDVTMSRFGIGIMQFGTTAANKSGLIQSAMTSFVTSDFTTSGVGTALEAITGLAITVPAVAANWSFHAHLAYHQNVATAAVGFGIQAQTNAPTNIMATGFQQTNSTAFAGGVLATLASTTATQVVSGTPSAITTNWVCDIYGTAELGASANTIRLLVSTATAADTVTVLRGSYISFTP